MITPHSTTQTARIRSAMADDLRAVFAADSEYGRAGLDDIDNDDDEVEVLASPLANRTRTRSASPGPQRLPTTAQVATEPAKEVKERPSLLSLRGLFSFFGSGAVDVEEDLATSPRLERPEQAEPEALSSSSSSPPPPRPTSEVVESEATSGPRRMRTVSDMHRWVETVNEVYPPLPPPASQPVLSSHMTPIPASTASSSTAVMPELHFEHAADGDDDDDDDAASCRSYSSSISFSGSPPTPQPVFGAVDYAVLVAPSSFSGGSSQHHLSPPMTAMHDADVPRNKRLSLRHTVSDSNLLPAYQSFAGLGISAPPTARSSQLAATKPGPAELARAGGSFAAVGTMAANASMSSTRGTGHGAGGSGLWGTTLLRTRASQLFSLAMARSPVDAATGRSFLTMPAPRPASAAASAFPSSFPGSGPGSVAAAARSPPLVAQSRAPPRLLRKAVSSAGLVSAPQVRRTRVVTKASWESFGSLEAKVSLDGGRPGSITSNGGGGDDADLDGGVGWGEDLLGRAWA